MLILSHIMLPASSALLSARKSPIFQFSWLELWRLLSGRGETYGLVQQKDQLPVPTDIPKFSSRGSTHIPFKYRYRLLPHGLLRWRLLWGAIRKRKNDTGCSRRPHQQHLQRIRNMGWFLVSYIRTNRFHFYPLKDRFSGFPS